MSTVGNISLPVALPVNTSLSNTHHDSNNGIPIWHKELEHINTDTGDYSKVVDIVSEKHNTSVSVPYLDDTHEDVGNIVGFEHINLTYADSAAAISFYVNLIGCTLDPVASPSKPLTLWFNYGKTQFHIPRQEGLQTVGGSIGLIIPQSAFDTMMKRYDIIKSLPEFQNSKLSIKYYQPQLPCLMTNNTIETSLLSSYPWYPFVFSSFRPSNCLTEAQNNDHWKIDSGSDSTVQSKDIKSISQFSSYYMITDANGNCYRVHPVPDAQLLFTDRLNCGIFYVELNVPVGTAHRIALFYKTILKACVRSSENVGGKLYCRF